MIKLIAVMLLLLCCSCAPFIDELTRDPRDTSYDPNYAAGESLFDQIPNWDQHQPKRVRYE